MNTEMSHARKPWVATSLSLICTGLGQIYCGRAGRGLVMYSASLLFGPVIIATALTANSTPMLVAFLLSVIGLVALVCWSVHDARSIARSLAMTNFELRDYNRPLVYFMLGSTSGPYVIGLACFLRATTIEAFIIPSSSMTPTLVPGDRVLVTKIGLNTQSFQRGDMVVFRNPINRQQTFVKRVIGLPGETVEIKKGVIVVNGQSLEQTPVAPDKNDAKHDKTASGDLFWEHAGDRQYRIRFDKAVDQSAITVPPDAYFVLGDHRDSSIDSREVGCVPHGLMVGILKYIYYPGDVWNRLGVPK